MLRQKQALYQYSQYLESKINDRNVKTALMLRAHEAMGGAFAQGKLATDRADAFMAEKRSAPAATPPTPPVSPKYQWRSSRARVASKLAAV